MAPNPMAAVGLVAGSAIRIEKDAHSGCPVWAQVDRPSIHERQASGVSGRVGQPQVPVSAMAEGIARTTGVLATSCGAVRLTELGRAATSPSDRASHSAARSEESSPGSAAGPAACCTATRAQADRCATR